MDPMNGDEKVINTLERRCKLEPLRVTVVPSGRRSRWAQDLHQDEDGESQQEEEDDVRPIWDLRGDGRSTRSHFELSGRWGRGRVRVE